MKNRSTLSPLGVILHINSRSLLRYALILVVYLISFFLLDYFSTQFGDLPGIVPWYPPAGLTYAFLLVFGVKFTPAVIFAYFIGSVYIHRMPQPIYLIFYWSLVISLVYAAAAAFLRNRIHFDLQSRIFRNVAWLVITNMLVSAFLAFLSVPGSLMSIGVERTEIFQAIFHWWIGETVGALTITPILLIYVMPGLKRVMEGQPVWLPPREWLSRVSLASIAQVISMVLIIYYVFGIHVPDEFNPLFLVALPLIWISLDHGFKGASVAILALNLGVLLAVWLFGLDLKHMGELELLIIVICIISLLMGAVITERKMIGESLSSSESKLRSLFASMQDAVLVIDCEGVYLEIAPTNLEAQFLTESELLGKKIQDIFPVEQAEFFLGVIHQVLDTKISTQIEYELNFSNQSIWYQASVSPMSVESTLWVARDITKQKEAEKQMTRLNLAVKNSSDAIFMTDSQGLITYINPGFTNIYGYTANEVVGKSTPRILKSGLLKSEDYKPFWETLLNKEVIIGEFINKTKDGRLLPIDGSANPIINQNNKIIGFLGIQHDITERKRAEEQIQNQVETLGALYDLTRKLMGMDDFEAILDLVTRSAVEYVHVTFACFLLLEQGDLVLRAAFPVRILEKDLKLNHREPLVNLPLCRRVFDGNLPMVLHGDNPEIGEFENFLFSFSKNLCIIPLHFQEQPFGILILGEARETAREPITPEKLRLAESIGDQAASALHRALLGEKARHRLTRITSLREIDNTIAASFDIRLSLEVILKHVVEQLKVDAVAVLVVNTNLQSLEYKGGRGFRTQAIEHMNQRLNEGQAGQSILERRMIHIRDVAASETIFVHPEFVKAEQVSSYIAMPLIVKGKANGVLEIFNRSPLDPDEEWLDFLVTLAGQAAIAIDNDQMFYSLQRSNYDLALAYDATIEGWSHALDLRDKETEGHSLRVTEMTIKLAQSLGLPNDKLSQIRRGALLHDIGKLGVPDDILHKPGPLTDEEWVLMRNHPRLAYDMISPIKYLQSSLDIPYCHHEKWDGSGYPRGLKGEQIPLAARIFAVVDVWDALTSDRPYRAAWTEEKVFQYIQEQSGTHFDPEILKVFLKGVSKFQKNIHPRDK